MVELKNKPVQVKIIADSKAERDRWKREAKRRKWSLNTLVRTLLNEELERQKAVGE